MSAAHDENHHRVQVTTIQSTIWGTTAEQMHVSRNLTGQKMNVAAAKRASFSILSLCSSACILQRHKRGRLLLFHNDASAPTQSQDLTQRHLSNLPMAPSAMGQPSLASGILTFLLPIARIETSEFHNLILQVPRKFPVTTPFGNGNEARLPSWSLLHFQLPRTASFAVVTPCFSFLTK